MFIFVAVCGVYVCAGMITFRTGDARERESSHVMT